MVRLLIYLWVLPVTLLGLLASGLARLSGGTVQWVDGVLESSGGWPARVLQFGFPFSGPVVAMTLGHVVIGVSASALSSTRTHERVHVRQYERWGILFLLLYPLAGVVARIRGGNPYCDNAFECEARAAEQASDQASQG